MYYVYVTYVRTSSILSLLLSTVGCESQDVAEEKSCCISGNELLDDTVATYVQQITV